MRRIGVAGVLAVLAGMAQAQDVPRVASVLTGMVDDVPRADIVTLGSIPVRLRGVYVEEAQIGAAAAFLRALAQDRAAGCRLTDERWSEDRVTLVGACSVFAPDDGRAIDLGAALIDEGLARACEEPAMAIAIYPPVYVCD